MSSPKFIGGRSIPNVAEFGDRTLREIVKVKRGYKGGYKVY